MNIRQTLHWILFKVENAGVFSNEGEDTRIPAIQIREDMSVFPHLSIYVLGVIRSMISIDTRLETYSSNSVKACLSNVSVIQAIRF